MSVPQLSKLPSEEREISVGHETYSAKKMLDIAKEHVFITQKSISEIFYEL